MKTKAFILLMLTLISTAVAAEIILLADFDDKPLDQPIGTGGAVVGEPSLVSPVIEAIVRASPDGGRMLEMFMTQQPTTNSVRFQFLDDQEVSSGLLLIQARIRLAAADEFHRVDILLREANGSSQSFLNMNLFSPNRRVQISRPGVPVIGFNQVLRLSDANDLALLYDLDEMQFTICLNGELLVGDLPALYESTRGIGGFLIAQAGSFGDTLVSLDEILVQRNPFSRLAQQTLFADRFEFTGTVCELL